MVHRCVFVQADVSAVHAIFGKNPPDLHWQGTFPSQTFWLWRVENHSKHMLTLKTIHLETTLPYVCYTQSLIRRRATELLYEPIGTLQFVGVHDVGETFRFWGTYNFTANTWINRYRSENIYWMNSLTPILKRSSILFVKGSSCHYARCINTLIVVWVRDFFRCRHKTNFQWGWIFWFWTIPHRYLDWIIQTYTIRVYVARGTSSLLFQIHPARMGKIEWHL